MYDISRYDLSAFDRYIGDRKVTLEAFIGRITASVESNAVKYPDNPTRILWIDTKFRVIFNG